MSRIEFIYHLVSSNFASQYEAEQHTLATGSGEWAYFNPFNKNKANTNKFGVVLYKYEAATDSYYSNHVFLS